MPVVEEFARSWHRHCEHARSNCRKKSSIEFIESNQTLMSLSRSGNLIGMFLEEKNAPSRTKQAKSYTPGSSLSREPAMLRTFTRFCTTNTCNKNTASDDARRAI